MSRARRPGSLLESNNRGRPTIFSENSLPTITEVSRTPTPAKNASTQKGSSLRSKSSPRTTANKERFIKSVPSFKTRKAGANENSVKIASIRQGDVLNQPQTCHVRRRSLPEILPSSADTPFRRPGAQRRGSVIGMLQSGGLDEKHKLKINTFVDLSVSEKYEKGKRNRRASIAAFSLAQRLSFGTIGSKITAVLKAKNAFTKLKNRAMGKNNEGDIDDNSFEIKELPEKPRFASTLSAEAQYAMMKGYEDVVYSNICSQYPEYRPVLRRNKTPHTGIKVKVQCHPDDEYSNNERKNIDVSNLDYYDGSAEKVDAPADTLTPTDDSWPGCITSPRISEGNASPRSSPPKKGNAVSSTYDHPARVMTYRYQSAMDILDTLRERQGLYRLSPRKTSTTIVSPVKEYNSWSNVWSHEFEPDKSSNSVAKV